MLTCHILTHHMMHIPTDPSSLSKRSNEPHPQHHGHTHIIRTTMTAFFQHVGSIYGDHRPSVTGPAPDIDTNTLAIQWSSMLDTSIATFQLFPCCSNINRWQNGSMTMGTRSFDGIYGYGSRWRMIKKEKRGLCLGRHRLPSPLDPGTDEQSGHRKGQGDEQRVDDRIREAEHRGLSGEQLCQP